VNEQPHCRDIGSPMRYPAESVLLRYTRGVRLVTGSLCDPHQLYSEACASLMPPW